MFNHLPAAVAALDIALSLGAVAGRLLLSAVVGVAVTVMMTTPMWRRDDGFTSAYVAAAIVRRTTPGEVNFGDANIAHHATDALTSILYAVVYLTTDVVTPDLGIASIGIDFPLHLVATTVVAVFAYVAFARLIFPHTGRHIYGGHAAAIRGQWLHSPLVLGATLLVLTPTALPGFT